MDGACGRSNADHHLREVAEDRAARAYHRPLADGDAGRDENIRRKPRFIFDHDGEHLDVKAGMRRIPFHARHLFREYCGHCHAQGACPHGTVRPWVEPTAAAVPAALPPTTATPYM